MIRMPRFIYNKTLAPDIFDENQNMHPEMSDALMDVVNQFLVYAQKMGFNVVMDDILDTYMYGSTCDYYWDDTSDIDIAIIIDMKKYGKILPGVCVDKLLPALAVVWGRNTKITINGRDLELHIVDVHNERETNGYLITAGHGLYSITNKRWIQKSVHVGDAELRKIRRNAWRKFMKIHRMHRRIVRRNYDSDFCARYLRRLWHERTYAYNNGAHAVEPFLIAYRMARCVGILDDLKRRKRRHVTYGK